MTYPSTEDYETINQVNSLSYSCSTVCRGPLNDEPLPCRLTLYALTNAQHPHAVTSIYLIIRFANVPFMTVCKQVNVPVPSVLICFQEVRTNTLGT